MELYYSKHLEEGIIQLDGEQFRHIVKVMRKKPGDAIELTDGMGNRGIATITSIGKSSAQTRVEELQTMPLPAYAIHIAVALTKNAKRIEWAIEKMTELGVRSITPLLCARSQRDRINYDRMEKILVAAIKQSRQYYLPELKPPRTLESFGEECLNNFEGQKFIAHISEGST